MCRLCAITFFASANQTRYGSYLQRCIGSGAAARSIHCEIDLFETDYLVEKIERELVVFEALGGTHNCNVGPMACHAGLELVRIWDGLISIPRKRKKTAATSFACTDPRS